MLACAALAGLAAAGTPAASQGPKVRASHVVPFKVIRSGGNPRPIVVARFNGHPLRMMVHSNASFYAQLEHAKAAAFGVVLTAGHRAFGIDRPGHVSDLGLDPGIVATLQVGNATVRDARVSVFEVPQDDYGMLGIGWIRDNRVVLDFARNQALVAPSPAEVSAKAAALRKAGYVALPMQFDEKEQRYTVRATLHGITRTMAVTSASELTVDLPWAEAAKLPLGKDTGEGSGPTGTHVSEYRLDAPIRLQIGDWTSPDIAGGSISDIYGYAARPRPADPDAGISGYLGGVFLKRTGAVIDFGSRILYVRSR